MEKSVEKLKKSLDCDLTEYRGVPFWSWNNELEEEELLRQIEDMKSAGLGGFMMHARTGLKTEYLGEKWFSYVGACLKKAKELGMKAWVYDENGWPSGFVGGKLLEREEYRARFLEYEERSVFDPAAFCTYVEQENEFARVTGQKEGVHTYHTVYLRVSPANTDILNPKVVDEFIRLTHEEYYKRFSESFGKELVGFFTDEPQYYRYATPYTHVAEEIFFERYGEDVKDGLIYLFLHDERGYAFRIKYYSLLNELYVTNYYKKLHDWCEAHHCKLSGHSFEESMVSAQMLGSAGVMRSYENEHVPTIDWLGRHCGGTELSPKQAGSVASQLGKRQVLTETFACAGYDVTPKELKSIGEFQFFCGVNSLCHHLFPYSLSAQGKYDHPPVFSKHGNWWEQFRVFNDYFARLGFIVANTKENYDVAIVHPLKNAYLEYVHSEGCDSLKELDDDFIELLFLLRENGIQYQLIDEEILATHGEAEGEALRVGECRYDCVILPKMQSLASSTVTILKGYKGRLLSLGSPTRIDGVLSQVELSSNITFEQIKARAKIKYRCEHKNSVITSRKGDIGEFIFIKNLSLTEPDFIRMQGIASSYKKIDLETLETENITDCFLLEENGSVILIKEETATPYEKREVEEDVTSAFALTEITENYLVMDYAEYSKDGKTFEMRQPIQQLFETLLREDYKGKVYIRQHFVLNDKIPLKLLIEKGNFEFLTINGKNVLLKQSDFDCNFAEADITEATRIGKNELLYCVQYYQHDGVHFALFDPMATESLRNGLYYNTHIENSYIKGTFRVENDFSISEQKSLPVLSDQLYQNGYPFFKGEITLTGTYIYDGKGERHLSLGGRFLVAETYINGTRTDVVLDNVKKITPFLKKGENNLRIVVRSSLRNLFGPHHYAKEHEPLCVNPYMFTFRGFWNGAQAEDYTHDYHLVPFGVNRITMIKSE